MSENSSRDILKREYQQKQLRNPRFSQRGFAKLIGVTPGRLSDLFRGKRLLSPLLAKRVAQLLKWTPAQTKEFVEVVQRENDLIKIDSQQRKHELKPISLQEFENLASWEHFAILSLMETKEFQSSPGWIAQRLNISSECAENALLRLERLNYIIRDRDSYILNKGGIATPTDIPSSALRKSHEQSIQQAVEALHNIDPLLRDITSITMAIDITKIKLAKKMIREFRYKLAKAVEVGNRTEVYNLNIQLFPLTKVSIDDEV